MAARFAKATRPKSATGNHVPVRIAGDERVLAVRVYMVVMRTDNQAHGYASSSGVHVLTLKSLTHCPLTNISGSEAVKPSNDESDGGG